jgi:hypothetical protein
MALSQVACCKSVDDQPRGLNVTIEPSLCLHVMRKSLLTMRNDSDCSVRIVADWGTFEHVPNTGTLSNMYCEELSEVSRMTKGHGGYNGLTKTCEVVNPGSGAPGLIGLGDSTETFLEILTTKEQQKRNDRRTQLEPGVTCTGALPDFGIWAPLMRHPVSAPERGKRIARALNDSRGKGHFVWSDPRPDDLLRSGPGFPAQRVNGRAHRLTGTRPC